MNLRRQRNRLRLKQKDRIEGSEMLRPRQPTARLRLKQKDKPPRRQRVAQAMALNQPPA
jgi:hypothetical protein